MFNIENKRIYRTEREVRKIYSILEEYNQILMEPYTPNPNMPEPDLLPIPDDVQKAFFDSFNLLKSCFEKVSGFRGVFCKNLVQWAFRSMQDAYNSRNTDVWPLLIQDEQTLARSYAAVYARISKIQLLLSKSFGVTRRIESAPFLLLEHITDLSIQDSHEIAHEIARETIFTSAIYTQLDMRKEIEAIAKCICKVHHDLLKYGCASDEFVKWKVLLRNLKLYDIMMSSLNVR